MPSFRTALSSLVLRLAAPSVSLRRDTTAVTSNTATGRPAPAHFITEERHVDAAAHSVCALLDFAPPLPANSAAAVVRRRSMSFALHTPPTHARASSHDPLPSEHAPEPAVPAAPLFTLTPTRSLRPRRHLRSRSSATKSTGSFTSCAPSLGAVYPPVQQLRLRARALYKELFYLAKEYPDPSYPIHQKLHGCFLAHVGADEERLRAGLAKAEFIKKELEAMYSMRKYRAMKRNYYDEPAQ
ncbi:hypothetical protein JCM10207_004259 [Rhodosporidiobolus poonsookiae]